MIADLVRLFDNVLTHFIERADLEIFKKKNVILSANETRAIGLSGCGLFSHFQSKMIDPESSLAKRMNNEFFETIKRQAVAGSRQLAKERREPKYMIGTGLRNSPTLAVVHNANTSIMLNSSPSIELFMSNYYVQESKLIP